MNNILRISGILTLGMGVLLVTVGTFIYYLEAERKKTLRSDSGRIRPISGETEQETRQTNTYRKRSVSSTVSDVTNEMLSAIGSEDEDDEYYDTKGEQETFLDGEQLSRIDELLEGTLEEQKFAYCTLVEWKESASNAELLWRLAQACYLMAKASNDEVAKKSYIKEGCNSGQKAVDTDDSNPEAHKWFAMLLGSEANFMDGIGKIKNACLFKKHVDEALELKPSDPLLNYLMGRFMYEVSSRTWLERKCVASFIGECTYEDALKYLLKAEKSGEKPWKGNRLFIAKCYEALEDSESASRWFCKAAEVEVSRFDDKLVEDEARKLCKRYR